MVLRLGAEPVLLHLRRAGLRHPLLGKVQWLNLSHAIDTGIVLQVRHLLPVRALHLRGGPAGLLHLLHHDHHHYYS